MHRLDEQMSLTGIEQGSYMHNKWCVNISFKLTCNRAKFGLDTVYIFRQTPTWSTTSSTSMISIWLTKTLMSAPASRINSGLILSLILIVRSCTLSFVHLCFVYLCVSNIFHCWSNVYKLYKSLGAEHQMYHFPCKWMSRRIIVNKIARRVTHHGKHNKYFHILIANSCVSAGPWIITQWFPVLRSNTLPHVRVCSSIVSHYLPVTFVLIACLACNNDGS